MSVRRRLRLVRLATVLLLCPGAWGCASDDPVDPEAELISLVGDWQADRFIVKNKANPSQAPELIGDLGAEFTLNIQPSGLYTALLVYQGSPITEIGQLDLDGTDVVFTVSYPAPSTSRSRYALAGNRLTLDGDTEFDFNFDGRGDPAEAHIELRKR
jgi:hypothetical protein